MTVCEVIDKINQITSVRNALPSIDIYDEKAIYPNDIREDIMDMLDDYREMLYDLEVKER